MENLLNLLTIKKFPLQPVYLISVQDTRVEYQEDVVHRDGAQEIKEEPGLDVLNSYQLGFHDYFFTVITFFVTCNSVFIRIICILLLNIVTQGCHARY